MTDNTDWTMAEIVAASLNRWQVESHFRQSKKTDLVGASWCVIGPMARSDATSSVVSPRSRTCGAWSCDSRRVD